MLHLLQQLSWVNFGVILNNEDTFAATMYVKINTLNMCMTFNTRAIITSHNAYVEIAASVFVDDDNF